jgi:hypothetical protein
LSDPAVADQRLRPWPAAFLGRPVSVALLAAATVAALAAIALLAAPARADEAAALPNGGIGRSLTQDEGRDPRAADPGGLEYCRACRSPAGSTWCRSASCPDCVRFETEQFPDIHRAGIDTRVIMVARRNRSTAPERSGVAELWAHRSGRLSDLTSMPVEAWTAEGLPSADTDPERAAQLERSRALVDELVPLLAGERHSLRLPDADLAGARWPPARLRLQEPTAYPDIRKELGLPNN